MAELTFETSCHKHYQYQLNNIGMVERFNKKHECEARLGDMVSIRVLKKFNKDTYNGETIQIPKWLT